MRVDCHMHMILDGVEWKQAIARHSTKVDIPWIRKQMQTYRDLGVVYLRDGGDRWGVGKRARELAEETGVEGLSLELVGVYSAPGRDPRGWVVSAAFVSVVDAQLLDLRAGDDAAEADWFCFDGETLSRDGEQLAVDGLAFDHGKILRDAYKQAAQRG